MADLIVSAIQASALYAGMRIETSCFIDALLVCDAGPEHGAPNTKRRSDPEKTYYNNKVCGGIGDGEKDCSWYRRNRCKNRVAQRETHGNGRQCTDCLRAYHADDFSDLDEGIGDSSTYGNQASARRTPTEVFAWPVFTKVIGQRL